jgi:hypothetical protein
MLLGESATVGPYKITATSRASARRPCGDIVDGIEVSRHATVAPDPLLPASATKLAQMVVAGEDVDGLRALLATASLACEGQP